MKSGLSQQGRTPSQSQHGLAATPPVSTPFSSTAHAAFSPYGPRSSPQHLKKSPANSATLVGYPTGSGSGGAGPVNFDSPSAAAAMGALGLTPGFADHLAGMDHVGVAGLAGLGSLGVRGEDERLKRLHAVIDILKTKKGHVSEAGLERLAREHKLDILWEQAIGGEKAKTLLIAGKAFAVEITLINNIVDKVSLQLESNDIVMKHIERAGEILYQDLYLPPNQSPLTKMLDPFAENLERIATLDKLGVMPVLNLHEAIAGIYASLERLYQWDLAKVGEDHALTGNSDEELALHVMCRRHGRPMMHTRKRVGLSIDYWKEMWNSRPRTRNTGILAEATEKTWAILVSCAQRDLMVNYPPVRVSDAWLSPSVEKLNPTETDRLMAGTEPLLDWTEPDNIILPADDAAKDNQAAGDVMQTNLLNPKYPEVCFMATFEPCVTIPLSIWIEFNQLIGISPDPEFSLATFDSITFPSEPGSHTDPSEPRIITSTRNLKGVLPDSYIAALKQSKNTLFIYKPVYGRTLESLPFSHPNQLVRMLPALRQYAFLSKILEKSFDAKLAEIFPPKEDKPHVTETTTVKQDFAMFMADSQSTQVHGRKANGSGSGIMAPWAQDLTKMDVTLTAHPVPRLQVVFPFRDFSADFMLEIRLNGVVYVVSQNILEENPLEADTGKDADRGEGKWTEPQNLGRALEICEDLNQWCEWIRMKFQ